MMTKTSIQRTRALLSDRWPNCFSGKKQPKRPLKLGIFFDIVRDIPEIGGVRLSEALRDYTSGPTYLSSVVEESYRIDLDGNPAGAVTASEAKHAADRLAAFRHYTKRTPNLPADADALARVEQSKLEQFVMRVDHGPGEQEFE